jgi:hypothetical protein
MPLGAILLLAAAVQPHVTDEVVWRDVSSFVAFNPAPQAARVAADGDGYLVAWSEVEDGISHAYAGRLNAAGQLTKIGVRTSGTGGAPSIARFGDRYIAAWLEPGGGNQALLVTGSFDLDFKLISARPIGFGPATPIVRTTPARAWLGAGSILYELDRDGAPLALFNTPRTLDDVAAAGNDVGYVLHEMTFGLSIVCPHGCGPRPVPVHRYNLSFTWLYRLTVGQTMIFDSQARAALAANGEGFLLVWAENTTQPTIKGAFFGTTFKPFYISLNGQRRFDARTQLQVAWDGVRWVAVWEGAHGIEGAVIERDLTATPFRISTGGWRPAIAASRPGRFLVTYEIESAGFHLASRLIDFTPPEQRERAIR